MRRRLLGCLWIFTFQTMQLIATSVYDPESFGVPTLLLDNLQLTLSSKLLVDIFSPTGEALNGYMGWLPKASNLNHTSCSGDESLARTICLKYGKNMKLTISQDNIDHCDKNSMVCQAVQCHKIRWEDHIGGAMDCFLLGDHFWYGGGEVISQRWPLQNEMRSWYPSVTGDPLHHPSGSVVENLWISSGGFAIYVEHTTPLFVSFNDTGNGKLCFTSSSKKYPYQSPKKSQLSYYVCSAASIKEVYSFSLNKWIEKPLDTPHETLFNHPIWSTWARYKQYIDENVILNFAAEINEYGFPASQLEIDDKWEECYGDLQFDYGKFSDPIAMISKLKSMGFSVTLWVTPFCNKNCNSYKIGEQREYWVKNKEGNTLEVKWWNGQAAVLDVTNIKARQWYMKRLQTLQKNFGVDSFKFDAGEILWFEEDFIFYDQEANSEPNTYSQLYAELAAKFGNRVEVRSGYNTQYLPVMVRIFDKYSNWDYANGLQTLIPNIFHLSLLGYYFVLPDMVGGNNYDSKGMLPDRELYIRWLEASTFMPFIQISIPPWDYDNEMVTITKKMLALRDRYIDNMVSTAHKTITSGEPIIRPLWWIAPDDTDSLQMDNEFLLGDDILVAPVLTKGINLRDIYLPDGKWSDIQRGKVYEGPLWLFDYEAPLNFLPFFIRHS